MRNLFRLAVFAVAVVCLADFSHAQFAGKRTDQGITCAADGSSTEVLPANGLRTSLNIINDSSTAVRIGGVNTGTPDLTDSNSIILTAYSQQNDNNPGLYLGRIVCMSTTASTVVIHVTENSLR
jgi:hypothetical protein